MWLMITNQSCTLDAPDVSVFNLYSRLERDSLLLLKNVRIYMEMLNVVECIVLVSWEKDMS